MIKAELIKCVANVTGSSKQAEAAVNAFVAVIGESLCKGENVAVPGLGTFRISLRRARSGRNPQTREAIEIPARNAVSFTPVAALKRDISDYTL